MMRLKIAVSILVLGAGCLCPLLGQQKKEVEPSPPGVQEFPVQLQQGVTAGKTPVGTKVQAKLWAATLVDGTVVPRNAIFSGEVIESVAKKDKEPSRVAIRMDSVQWKNGSAVVKVYLTAWYYPARNQMGQDLEYGPPQPANRTWNGEGQYPDPNSKVYKPFPGTGEDKDSVPDTPNATVSNHRVLMKDVVTTSGSDGTLTLVSARRNLKLDKLTTYVLSSGDLIRAK